MTISLNAMFTSRTAVKLVVIVYLFSFVVLLLLQPTKCKKNETGLLTNISEQWFISSQNWCHESKDIVLKSLRTKLDKNDITRTNKSGQCWHILQTIASYIYCVIIKKCIEIIIHYTSKLRRGAEGSRQIGTMSQLWPYLGFEGFPQVTSILCTLYHQLRGDKWLFKLELNQISSYRFWFWNILLQFIKNYKLQTDWTKGNNMLI